ncbi:hypothetical protein CDAR_31961 [Caerostris darwini]|uniref:Uncharacterized protein n=1 Tax=Caerostris darwini TaxID=1538125 RepID=A0AAV4RTR9_9ARAC|nr:hypothetical protein CDAR_31961 [Caerostris darwini]
MLLRKITSEGYPKCLRYVLRDAALHNNCKKSFVGEVAANCRRLKLLLSDIDEKDNSGICGPLSPVTSSQMWRVLLRGERRFHS